jgi:hypothetical protein
MIDLDNAGTIAMAGGVRCGSLWRPPRRWQWLSNDDGQLAALLFAASSPSFSAIGSNQIINKIPAISAPMRWHRVQQRVRKNSPGSGRPDAEDSVRRCDIGSQIAGLQRVLMNPDGSFLGQPEHNKNWP